MAKLGLACISRQAVLGDVHPFEAASGREVELRVPVGAPRGDDAEAAMAVLPRQIVDRVERLGGNFQSLRLVLSTVRLYVLNPDLVVLREWRDLPGCVLEARLRGSDR